MTSQVLMRSPPVTRRKVFYTVEDQKTAGKGKKYGEVVGGTAAECAAVCCCCPCTVMELLILGLYKVPTGLCKKAWRRRKRQRFMKKKKNQGLLLGPANVGPTRAELEAELDRIVGRKATRDDHDNHDNHDDDGSTQAVDLEKEMWERFYGTGFWRSPSMRET